MMIKKIRASLNLDQMGMSLSFLCAIHCIVTPFALLFLPIIGRSFENPLIHWLLAIFVIPIGFLAFYTGYRHHRRARVYWLGVPGLIIVGLLPLVFPSISLGVWSESILMIAGSAMLMSAHWVNRRSCSCAIHGAEHSTTAAIID